ncbi:MAG: hydrolase [Microbacteriaceae bacterium]|nr:hydrolase [Microbacteriaceae bacterium]
MDFATNPIDGAHIAYRTTGTGPPIVMVHGTALSQAIWRGFGYVRDLAVDHTAITLDLRGHGRSDKPHERSAYRMDLFIADVLAVLDELGIDRAHYLGYSLGGRVGFSLAATSPERMLSLISAGGAPRIGSGSFDRVFFPGCVETLETGGMAAFLVGWEAHSGTLDATTRAAFAANDPIALAAYMREADSDEGVADAALAGIQLPTLLMVGSRDGERLPSAEAAGAVMPNATRRILDGATHADTLRHPEALPAIREFLRRL